MGPQGALGPPVSIATVASWLWIIYVIYLNLFKFTSISVGQNVYSLLDSVASIKETREAPRGRIEIRLCIYRG